MSDSTNAEPEPSDETIRRFLLGSLSSSEQPLFEQRLISDDRLEERARLIEFDLVDDYACDRLKSSDRRLFKQKFLVTEDRKGKLAVSELLSERFSSAEAVPQQPERKSFAPRWARFLRLDRRAWRLAFGAVIVLILFGAVLLVVKEPRRLAGRIANRIVPKRLVSRSVPREVNHPTNTSGPEHQTTASPLPIHDSVTQSVQRVALFPSPPDIGKIPTLPLSKGEGDVLHLQLVVIANPAEPYSAEVLTIGGQSVMVVDWLQGQPLELDIPMRLLKPGKYRVRLSYARTVSRKEEVASYYFLVH